MVKKSPGPVQVTSSLLKRACMPEFESEVRELLVRLSSSVVADIASVRYWSSESGNLVDIQVHIGKIQVAAGVGRASNHEDAEDLAKREVLAILRNM